YALLSVLLARAPDAGLLERLGALRGDASPLGLAHVALAEAAQRANVERLEREYFDLFIGLGRGELLPYGSYYLTGFLHDRPLAAPPGQARAGPPAGPGGPRGSRGVLVRDLGGACEPPLPCSRRFRSRVLRAASSSVDRALLRRSGTGRSGGFLPGSRKGRPGVYRDRNRCFRAALVSSAESRNEYRRRRQCNENARGRFAVANSIARSARARPPL